MKEAAGEEEAELAEEMAQAFLSENLPETMFGAPKAGPGMWASVIRVMDPADGRTTHTVRLEQNEAALRWVALLPSPVLLLYVLYWYAPPPSPDQHDPEDIHAASEKI